ncbi:tyrosine-type recombinase/integrase [Methylibium sp.]|jgi:integrase|uniref:tyrosine-type recombinase/integrase n=1 Tax=Methylibium sp. TaxID=2067992 RepID=UPI003D10F0B8
MAFQKTPSYLYRKSPGSPYYLKLPVPPALRHHYPDAKGKPRTHIVVPLDTAKEAEAEQNKRPLLTRYWAEFKRLESGKAAAPTPDHTERLQLLRESMRQAQVLDDEGVALGAVEDAARAFAEELEQSIGDEGAGEVYRLATQPDSLSMREALKQWNEGADVRESTRSKRTQAVNELLSFLKVNDCLPSYVDEGRAVAYVDWLNAGKLGHSTKQDRLSTLNVLWGFLERRRQLPRGSSPWGNHEVTKTKATSAAEQVKEKRGWREAEVLKLFSAPDGEGIKSTHYTRKLFRELYALGFLTGMRLDEIVSLRPETIEPIKGPRGKGVAGYWLDIEASKTDAGVRTIPVVHPAAVAVLQARLEEQKGRAVSLFPECRPGGPDNKLSWHVQKALGRDRDRLGFGSEVDFHSTRRSFMSMMENSGADVVHVQRYVGHRVPTLMHSVYSDGASGESLLKVARAVKYSTKVEAVLGKLVP